MVGIKPISEVTIGVGVACEMAHDLIEVAPNEGCGFLLGDDKRIASIWAPLKNRSDTPRIAFSVSEADILQMLRRFSDKQVVAFVHSHPYGDASLSSEDLELLFSERIALWPYPLGVFAQQRGELKFWSPTLPPRKITAFLKKEQHPKRDDARVHLPAYFWEAESRTL